LVAATSVETGRFVPVEKPLDRDDLTRLLHQLSTIDQGYAEVRLEDHDFPALLVGFRRGFAVVHCMSSLESMALLGGDGSVAGLEPVDVLVMDDLSTFTGDYVMKPSRARDVLMKFADGVGVRSLGEWHDL
jgi:hypothetical protein